MLSSTIQTARRFIQNQDGSILQNSPSNRNPLLLSARQLNTPLANFTVVPLFELLDKVVPICRLGRRNDIIMCRSRMSVGNILSNGPAKQAGILKDSGNRLTQ